MTLIDEITQRLQVLTPELLQIEDDSDAHRGHRGNQGGGHFTLRVKSSQFSGKSQIMRHRMVYHCLQDLMPNRIHALSITALAVDE